MLNRNSRLTLALLLVLGVFLLKTDRTSADLTAQRTVRGNHLRATTLALAEQHTASFTSLSMLFNTPGYLPGGFDIKAMILKKVGEMNFKYQLKTEIVGEQNPLCNNMKLQGLKNWVEAYNGPLANFEVEASISENNSDNWIFVLSFPEGVDNLKNLSCNFDLVARTWRDDPNENFVGFWSKRKLTNLVTTGSW